LKLLSILWSILKWCFTIPVEYIQTEQPETPRIKMPMKFADLKKREEERKVIIIMPKQEVERDIEHRITIQKRRQKEVNIREQYVLWKENLQNYEDVRGKLISVH
jgi:hypothetical protein